MAKTNRMLFKPTVIFSSPYSPTISQTKMNETFQNQKNEYQTIVYNSKTKEEQDTENTRRLRDNDLFTEPEECTSWATRAKYVGMLNPENQPQTSLMKLNSIDIWPTPTMMNAVKSYLGFGNSDKEFTQNVQSLMKPQNKRNINELNNEDIAMLPEDLFLNLLDHKFNLERTFENDNEQFENLISSRTQNIT